MNEKLLRLFKDTAAKVAASNSPCDAEREMEVFLHEVQMHPEERESVCAIFRMSLNTPGTPWEFLQFCFHSLRWPEMQTFVREGLDRDMNNIRARAIWAHLLESFDDDWEDAEFFQKFRSRT